MALTIDPKRLARIKRLDASSPTRAHPPSPSGLCARSGRANDRSQGSRLMPAPETPDPLAQGTDSLAVGEPEPSAAERQIVIAFAMYEALIRAESDLHHAYHTTRSMEDADRFEAGRDIVRAALAKAEGQ